MALILTDDEIKSLINEKKEIPLDFFTSIKLTSKLNRKFWKKKITGENGSAFHVFIRQAVLDPFNFSVGLTYTIPSTNKSFILKRYNGNYHRHTNKIERETFDGYHVHTATSRYQEFGGDEEGYAEITFAYSDLNGALRCMEKECGFVVPRVNAGLNQFEVNNGF
jgi:hypothetical protein